EGRLSEFWMRRTRGLVWRRRMVSAASRFAMKPNFWMKLIMCSARTHSYGILCGSIVFRRENSCQPVTAGAHHVSSKRAGDIDGTRELFLLLSVQFVSAKVRTS